MCVCVCHWPNLKHSSCACTHTHTYIYLYMYTYISNIYTHKWILYVSMQLLLCWLAQWLRMTKRLVEVMWRLLSLWLCCLPPSSFRNSVATTQKPAYSKRTYKEPKHLDDLSNVTELPTQGELPDGHTHVKQINVIISHCSGWMVTKYLTQQTAARVRRCLRKSRAPGTAPWWGWENREVPDKAGKEKLLLERKM